MSKLELKSWRENGLNNHFLGWSPENDLVCLSHSYGSLLLRRLNFEGVRDHLMKFSEKFGAAPIRFMNYGQDRDESDWVYVNPTDHWLVKWIDYLMIRSDAPSEIIAEAQKCLDRLNDYPIWDEDRYCDEQWKSIYDYWDGLKLWEKVEYCKEAELSIFAARRFPEEIRDDFLNNPDFG